MKPLCPSCLQKCQVSLLVVDVHVSGAPPEVDGGEIEYARLGKGISKNAPPLPGSDESGSSSDPEESNGAKQDY